METLFGLDYPTLWFIVIAFLFVGYAVLDGYDFGVGMWHLFFKDDMQRRKAINSVGPLWDGNEVWLVIAGGSIFAGFPLLYASLFSGMYIPFMLFLLFLIFRAISIEVRSKEPMLWWRKTWDVSYAISSGMLPLLLGVVLGNVMQGIQIGENFDYQGAGFFEFLTPYPLLVGLFAVATLLWHGSLFLAMKTEDAMQQKIIRYAKPAFLFFVMLFAATTFYTFLVLPQNIQKFNDYPLLWILPILVVVCILYSYTAYKKGNFALAFIASCSTIALLLTISAITLFPQLLISTIGAEYSITIYNAASSEKTLGIMLLMVGIGAPLLLAYTTIALYIFRGKVKLDENSY